jgi:hypothetical protein
MSQIKLNSDKVFIEKHSFFCYRYDTEYDRGLTDNLLGFLRAISLSDIDENLKLTANGLLKNTFHTEKKIFTDEEIKECIEKNNIPTIEQKPESEHEPTPEH